MAIFEGYCYYSSPLQYESDELEKCVYQDYDSDSDVPDELKQDYVDEQTGDVPLKRSVQKSRRDDVIPRDLTGQVLKYYASS